MFMQYNVCNSQGDTTDSVIYSDISFEDQAFNKYRLPIYILNSPLIQIEQSITLQ